MTIVVDLLAPPRLRCPKCLKNRRYTVTDEGIIFKKYKARCDVCGAEIKVYDEDRFRERFRWRRK